MNHQPRPRHWRVLGLIAIVGALALASCSDNDSDGGSTDSDPGTEQAAGAGQSLSISSQDFAEQKTLAQVYGQYLEAQGFEVDIQDPIGSRTQIFAAMDAGDLDMVIDYAGSAVVELGGAAEADPDATYVTLQGVVEEKSWEVSEQSEAADANALVALATWADDNGVTTISDLADVDEPVDLGGAAECAERPECLVGYQEIYKLDLGFKTIDYGPPLVAALEADEIQVAQYGSTAPEIASGTIIELTDDLGLQDAQNVVPIFVSDISSPELIEALNTLSAAITTEDLAGWNQATDVDKEESADVAQAWLEDNDLI